MSRSVRWVLLCAALVVIGGSGAFIARGSGNPAARSSRGHECAIEDDAFVTADGGCKDLATGLVWGTKNMGHQGAGWGWRSARRLTADAQEGGMDDWRLPTVDELRQVLGNGAASHFRGGHVFGPDYAYWSADASGSRRFAVNTETHAAAAYLEETALYFVGVRETAAPDPVAGE